ncbi:hypothetical protein C8J56DRAFT_1041904 [Mycena floridula]|nr:hypothetical protein C8J56DRAFT_1041904 [Mycena floridula]
MSSSEQVNGHTTKETLEADIARLSSLLADDGVDVGEDVTKLAEMLTRLDDAEGVAKGLEGKLDNVLANLDTESTNLQQDCSG